jgi:formylglycine-generating enzyme required for sulfatase activity
MHPLRTNLVELNEMDRKEKRTWKKAAVSELQQQLRLKPVDGAHWLPELYHPDTEVRLRYIPSGYYSMGFSEKEEEVTRRLSEEFPISDATIECMRPVHKVYVKHFLISTIPILNETAATIVRLDDTGKSHLKFPASLTKAKAEKIVAKLGGMLPSEEQWEYACRGGTTTPFFWGSKVPLKRELERVLLLDFTKMKRMKANPFGLYCLFYSEWCKDRFTRSYKRGAQATKAYAIRGGGAYFWPWQDQEWLWCLSALRSPSLGLEDGRSACRIVINLEG